MTQVTVTQHRSRLRHARLLFIWVVGLLLIPTACAPSSTSSLPAGWTSYHDTRFSFQLPVPPGWHAGAFSDGPLDDETCAWVVDVLPPNVPGPPEKATVEHVPELMSVTVNVSCHEWQPSDDTHFVPEAHPITISGATATLYDNDTAGYGVERVAVTKFGGHQYRIYMQSHTSPADMSDATTQRDLALYKQMLQGFTYQGK